MGLTLRHADTGDLDEIGRLWRGLTEWHRALQPQRPFRSDAWEHRRRDFECALRVPQTNRVALAEADGQAVGVLWCAIRDAEPSPRLQPARYAEIEVLAVSAAARGQGVGTFLMRDCQGWREENGITRAVLKVVAGNEGARRFYERFGFQSVNVIMEQAG